MTKPDSILLRQPDLGGGQLPPDDERPRGTRPVGAFVGPLSKEACGPPGASGPWRTADGEVEAATEDGVPGSNAVRFEEALEQGVVPGVEDWGALYAGPERRKNEAESAGWTDADRRERPFTYAGDQEV